MIYALVEPSIYMIASILPTTRHLIRRVYRYVRGKSMDTAQKGSSGSYNSAELNDLDAADSHRRGITRNVAIWQAHTFSSQEELTLGQWYRNQQEWNGSKKSDAAAQKTGT